jgi:hypothetical protein
MIPCGVVCSLTCAAARARNNLNPLDKEKAMNDTKRIDEILGQGKETDGKDHKCPYCSTSTPFPTFVDKFCPQCGLKQVVIKNPLYPTREQDKVCPHCITINPSGSTVCKHCGKKMEDKSDPLPPELLKLLGEIYPVDSRVRFIPDDIPGGPSIFSSGIPEKLQLKHDKRKYPVIFEERPREELRIPLPLKEPLSEYIITDRKPKENVSEVRCVNCGSMNHPNNIRCAFCGEKVTTKKPWDENEILEHYGRGEEDTPSTKRDKEYVPFCYPCQKSSVAGAKFCIHCGKRL